MAVLYEIWMPWYCSIFTTSTGSGLAVEDHSVTRDLGRGGGGGMGKGRTIHMSCFYSNCWPGAWVSDYCLLTTFEQASRWMRSNAAVKLFTSASEERCWGPDEARIHGERSSFLCHSIFLLVREVSLAICTRARRSSHPKTLATAKGDDCQTISDLIGSDLFKTFLDLLPCWFWCLQMCSTESVANKRFLCVSAFTNITL